MAFSHEFEPGQVRLFDEKLVVQHAFRLNLGPQGYPDAPLPQLVRGDAREAEQPAGIGLHDLFDLVVGHVGEHLGRALAAVGPVGIGVREVDLSMMRSTPIWWRLARPCSSSMKHP